MHFEQKTFLIMGLTGYSGTALTKKLGITVNTRIRVVNAPNDYFELLNADFPLKVVKNGSADLVHIFAVSRSQLELDFSREILSDNPELVIWISWYKKAARIPTDITEDLVREIVLPTGWVDVKVCAVSDIWSGLKIVKRKANR